MRFAFIAKYKDMLSVNRLCQIMDVSPRGYRAGSVMNFVYLVWPMRVLDTVTH